MDTKILPGKQGSRNLTVRLVDTDINAEDFVRNIIIQNDGVITDERGDYGSGVNFNYPGLLIRARFNSTETRDEAYNDLKEAA